MNTTLLSGEPPEQHRPVVAERMDLIGEWITAQDHALELYADHRIGDGCLVYVPRHRRAEPVGSIYHAGGVLRGVVWTGFASEQPGPWRKVQRALIASTLASWHAEGPR